MCNENLAQKPYMIDESPVDLALVRFTGEHAASLDEIVAPLMKLVGAKVSNLERWNAEVERIESLLLNVPQADMPVTHRLAHEQYSREVFIPAGTFAIGHAHRHSCFDFVLQGRALVVMNGTLKEVVAPCVMVSEPGARKVGIIIEDMRWATTHPTNETDPDRLEDLLLIKSPSFLRYQKAVNPERIEQDHASFGSAIKELGVTHEEVQAMTLCDTDLMPMPDEFVGTVYLLPSKIHGKGIFAGKMFDAGDRIAPARIGSLRTPAGRFVNHSAYPNATAEINENGDIFFVAADKIPIGIEITADYRQVRKIAA